MRVRYSSIILICMVLLSCDNLRKAVGTVDVYENTAVVSEFELSHPGLAVLKDGSCMVVFARGNETGRQSIAITRSGKGIRGWSGPADIVETGWRIGNPGIVRLLDGLVLILFSQSRFDEISQTYIPIGIFMTESYDDGRTFTAPRMVIQDNSRDIRISGCIREIGSGRIIFTAWSGAAQNRGESDCFVSISDDRGISWRTAPVSSGTRADGIILSRPCVIQTDQGCVCMMQGSDGFLYQSSASRIEGEWSAPWRTDLAGAGPCLARPETGTLYTVFADQWPRGLSAARSYDRGLTWEDEGSLAEEKDAYGSASLKASGKKLFYAWLGRTDKKYCVHVRLETAGPPGAPRGVSAMVTQDSTVHIRWNKQASADYYVVYRGAADTTAAPGLMKAVNTAAKPSYTDHSIETGKDYWYAVTTVCGTGKLIQDTGMESVRSKPVRITVK